MKRGFTLMELIIIIIVMAIIASVVFVSWPGQSVNVNTSAERLANDLRYMQYISHGRDKTYQITFVPASARYDLFEVTDSGNEAFNHPFTNSNEISLPSGISLAVNSAISSDILRFDAEGEPLVGSSGTALSSTGQITISADGKSAYVCVKRYTGLVEVKSSAC